MRSHHALLILALLAGGCHAASELPSSPGQATGDGETGGDEQAPSDEGEDGEPAGDDSGGSLSFVPEQDLVGVSQCDPFAQDCEPGQKCVPYGSTGGNWDANKCVPVLGDGKIGDPCTYDGVIEATDSCDASSMCWDVADVDGEAIGTCSAFCTGTADNPECPSGSSCSISCDGSLTVCIKNCDPLAQDCLGLGCYYTYGDQFNCIFSSDDLETGEPCGFINDCIPGDICLSADVMPDCAGAACCSEFCDLGAPACTQPGTECVAFFEAGEVPELDHLGVCILPQG
jgi:hypothetical protein